MTSDSLNMAATLEYLIICMKMFIGWVDSVGRLNAPASSAQVLCPPGGIRRSSNEIELLSAAFGFD